MSNDECRMSNVRDSRSAIHNSQGFTLLELLIVISIIGLLLAYTAPRLVGRIVNQARVVACRQQMEEVKKALVGDPSIIINGQLGDPGYVGDVGSYPPAAPNDSLGFTYLMEQPPGVPLWNPYTGHGWNGPYIRADSVKRFATDPWGNSFRFIRDAGGNPTGLESAGPDGVFDPPPPTASDDNIQVMW